METIIYSLYCFSLANNIVSGFFTNKSIYNYTDVNKNDIHNVNKNVYDDFDKNNFIVM